MGTPNGSGRRRLLLAMALASGITSVPNAAIVLALPTIHRHFDASLTELQWTVTGYLLADSALLIAAKALDQFPADQHASITDAVHHAFTSALGSTMRLSFAIVVAGIVLTLLLIRREPAVDALPRPNVTEPFSGLATRP